MDVKTALPPFAEACPPDLRVVLDAWKAGRATNADLIEASYTAQLDCLEAYRWRALPTPPDAVVSYRALSFKDREQWTAEECRQYYDTHKVFYASERQVNSSNDSNPVHLKDLLAWGMERQLPEVMLHRVREALQTHEDHAVPPPWET